MKYAALIFLALAACGSSDPLVGTWVDTSLTDAGTAPDVKTYKATLVLNANKSMSETVIETNSGTAAVFPGCTVMSTVTGTWSEATSGPTKTVTITTTGGTHNVRTLCINTVDNNAGSPFAATDGTSFAFTYTVTGDSLILTPSNAGLGVQFTKQ